MSKPRDPLVAGRREEIIDAAVRCISRRGINQLKLRDIAKESGKSLGSIYNYFESKEAIIEAVVEREAERFVELVYAPLPLDGGATFGERLRAHMARLADAYLEEEGARLSIFIIEGAVLNTRVRHILEKANRRVHEQILRIARETSTQENLSATASKKMLVRIVLMRSMFEAARGISIFHPELPAGVLRETLIRRSICVVLHEMAEDMGISVEALEKSTTLWRDHPHV